MAGALQAIIRLGSATWRTHQSGRKVPKTTKSTCNNKKICSGPSKQLETERRQLTDEQDELQWWHDLENMRHCSHDVYNKITQDIRNLLVFNHASQNITSMIEILYDPPKLDDPELR
jgi:hypothetical protein